MALTAVSTTADALVVTWSLPAPPESVWAGWSDPALLAQWLGRPIERDLGSGLVDSYAPGWITHLTFLEAAVAGTPLPLAHFWQLYATVDSLLTRRP